MRPAQQNHNAVCWFAVAVDVTIDGRHLQQPAGFQLNTFFPYQINRVATTQLTMPFLRDPDVQAMLRVKEGDQAAFSELVSAYQHRLIAIFVHLTGDRATAEDLAQDVFLRIYRARNGYEPTARFSTYVFRIAHNLASNSRRSQGRRKEVQMAGDKTGPLTGRPQEHLLKEKSALMPTRQVDRLELRERVREAMETLNDRQRMALLLHKFEDLSYADIGDAMEMSPEAVKSLLSRARESLRTKLEPYMK